MRTHFVVPLVAMALASGCSADTQTNICHKWERIDYPSVPTPWDENDRLVFAVGSGHRDENPQFLVHMMWSSAADRSAGDRLPNPTNVIIQLHRPDGTVVKPEPRANQQWSAVGGSLGWTWSSSQTFPWSKNGLEEGWVEVRFPQLTYWLEVPYGFTGGPKRLFSSPDPTKGEPSLVPAMRQMKTTDRVIRWQAVEYDLGPIQNGWRLSLKQSNPFDASCDVQVHFDEYNKWDLHTPRCSVQITDPNGQCLKGFPNAIRKAEGCNARIDSFTFNRFPYPERTWGTVMITVDDKTYPVVVPSSLYKYTHGIAEPYHKQTIQRQK